MFYYKKFQTYRKVESCTSEHPYTFHLNSTLSALLCVCYHTPFWLNSLRTLEGILCTLAPPTGSLAPGRGHQIIGAKSVFKSTAWSLLSWEKVELPTILLQIASSSLTLLWASLVAQLVKNPLAISETWVWPLGWEDPLEKGKAAHSSLLAWRIPWTVESMGSQRVRHDWVMTTTLLCIVDIKYDFSIW